jgi:hypothetical protein
VVKYVCKYADGKISLVYTEGITMGFKKDKLYGDVIFLSTECLME